MKSLPVSDKILFSKKNYLKKLLEDNSAYKVILYYINSIGITEEQKTYLELYIEHMISELEVKLTNSPYDLN